MLGPAAMVCDPTRPDPIRRERPRHRNGYDVTDLGMRQCVHVPATLHGMPHAKQYAWKENPPADVAGGLTQGGRGAPNNPSAQRAAHDLQGRGGEE